MKRMLSLALAAAFVFSCTGDADARTHHAPSIASSNIVRMQDKLETLGFHAGPRDGLVGPQTRAAVRAFQKSVGMKPTGIFNLKTVALLCPPLSPAELANNNAGPVAAMPIAYEAKPWQNMPLYTGPSLVMGAHR